MAGEAVLSSLMQVVFEKAFIAARQEIGLVRGVHKELNKLSETLLTIRAVLEDAEERQIKDVAVRNWLRNLKDVAYAADDLLDEVTTRELQLKIEGEARNGKEKQVCNIFSSCSSSDHVFRRHKLAHRIKAIRERMDEIANERDNLQLRPQGETTRLEIVKRSSTSPLIDESTSSLIDESLVFGREEDKKKILNMLVSEESSMMNLSVLPIVGLGGLGKTTLAQLVYNDRRVKAHFDLKMWVYVSPNYNISRLTEAILEAATRKKFELRDLNLLQESLEETLKGSRFLLVLDDLWNENRDEWERLRLPLAAGGRGSKVMITTRSMKVARATGNVQPHILSGLQDDACWKLFCKFAFTQMDAPMNPRLEAIGRKMLEKVKGFPLAAKALGSLLYSHTEENEWEYILQSETWELASHKDEILPALRLSYQNLPPHLKQCFSYCSIFPGGHEFDKDKLIKIWMANGLIQREGRKRLEDIGAKYFDDLLCRSFFHYFKSSYVMHDMIHALAQSVSADECYIAQDDRPIEIPSRVRHLSLSSYNSVPNMLEKFYGCSGLRTLVALHGLNSRTIQVPDDLFSQLRLLRLLDFSGSFIRDLPDNISKLKHLRYLDLSATALERLPESVTTLYNLETLKLKDCYALHELPRGMSNLINLRHLEADSKLVSMISGIGKLTCLQELQEFAVQNEDGFRIAELKDMTELQGRLLIWKLENVVSGERAQEAKLNKKQCLNMLEFDWAADRRHGGVDEEVLEGLEPHFKLKELNIDGYNGVKFPSWVGNSSFTGLEKIYLYYCRKCNHLPPLGQLPWLQELSIHGMPGVKLVGQEFSGHGLVRGFPSLKVLCFEEMLEWEEWFGIQGDQFPRLQELVIKDCPKLRGLPELPPTLAKLEIYHAGVQSLPGLWSCEEMRPMSSSTSSATALASSSSSASSSTSLLSSSLSHLYLFNCPNLSSMREGLFCYHLRDLQDLTIWQCGELVSFPEGGFQSLTSLRNLVIEDCPKLKSSPEAGGLPSLLINLSIISCQALDDFLFSGELSCLSSLHISGCPGFTSLPAGLTSLKELKLHNCHKLMVFPADEVFQSLISLKHLEIEDCPKLMSLPMVEGCGLPASLQVLHISSCLNASSWLFEGLEALASLQDLHIINCANLRSLPQGIHNLESLHNLHVHNCPQIMALPDDGLPAVLQCFSIWECPRLKERCQKVRGLDWAKITYIPTILVDGLQL